MDASSCARACVAGIIALIVCGSFSVASAETKTVTCKDVSQNSLYLYPGDSFVLKCEGLSLHAVPKDFHKQACPGPKANCNKPVPYSEMFPTAGDYQWVTPYDDNASGTAHTWQAPPANKLTGFGNKVFSVGCSINPPTTLIPFHMGICYVDVTVWAASSASRPVASAVLLVVCSIASLALL